MKAAEDIDKPPSLVLVLVLSIAMCAPLIVFLCERTRVPAVRVAQGSPSPPEQTQRQGGGRGRGRGQGQGEQLG